jgi:hypothetical protein
MYILEPLPVQIFDNVMHGDPFTLAIAAHDGMQSRTEVCVGNIVSLRTIIASRINQIHFVEITIFQRHHVIIAIAEQVRAGGFLVVASNRRSASRRLALWISFHFSRMAMVLPGKSAMSLAMRSMAASNAWALPCRRAVSARATGLLGRSHRRRPSPASNSLFLFYRTTLIRSEVQASLRITVNSSACAVATPSSTVRAPAGTARSGSTSHTAGRAR